VIAIFATRKVRDAARETAAERKRKAEEKRRLNALEAALATLRPWPLAQLQAAATANPHAWPEDLAEESGLPINLVRAALDRALREVEPDNNEEDQDALDFDI